MIIGLTGQTGAGKSTVSEIFEQNGFAVINADIIARKVAEKGSACLEKIQYNFGNNVICNDGSLNRKKLGDIVFSDKKKLDILNSIMYPEITAEIKKQIKILFSENKNFILLDAPTLFESGADCLCDFIVSVIADDDIRKKRIIKRDNLTEKQALNRMNSQHNQEFFIQNSDYLIKNNNSLEETLSKASDLAIAFIKSANID